MAAAYPKHPHEGKLLSAAIKLRAAEINATSVTNGIAKTGSRKRSHLAAARADFDAALQAVIFPAPGDTRFYLVWAKHPLSARLASHVKTAWEALSEGAPGKFGENPPLHYTAKV